VSGTPPLRHQWFKDGSAISFGTNLVLTLPNAQAPDAGDYSLVVANSLSAATSAVARLTVVQPPTLSLQVVSTNGLPGTQVLLPIRASQFTNLSSLRLSLHWNPARAAFVGVEQFGVTGLAAGHFGTNAAGSGTLTVSWADAGGVGRTVAEGSVLFAVRLRLVGIPGEASDLSFDGTPVGMAVTNANGAPIPLTTSPGALTIIAQPPAITTQPLSRIVYSGSNVSFTVVATGTAPMNYQWRWNGTNLTGAGATTPTLTLPNVQRSQAGVYSVVVSNFGGVLISSNVALTVLMSLTEALDAPGAIWITNGTPPWFAQTNVTHDGVDAAQSGAVADGKNTYMQTTVLGPRTVSFWWKVSSETNKDLLQFFVGSTEQARLSGEVDWQARSFNVGAGSQVLKWTYLKSSSGAQGQDRAWVDQVRFLPEVPPAVPAGLSATAVSSTRIDLRWTDGATDEMAFIVERSTNGINFSQLALLGSNVTSFANTGLLAGATWFYRVASSNIAGASAYSDVASATTPEFASIRINFQPASAPVPAGYMVDGGLAFADRGNGLAYGWNSSLSGTKDRNSTLSPDQRYDTFIATGTSSSTRWDLALPNGIYNVFVVVGDAGASSGTYKVGVEGVVVVNGTVNTSNRWVSGRPTWRERAAPRFASSTSRRFFLC
jgi:hypothetical protein